MNPFAAHNLGVTYSAIHKPVTAFKWYTKAAELGLMDSLLQVALCHLFGIGTEKKLRKGADCLNRIITAGNPPKEVSEGTFENACIWQAFLIRLSRRRLDNKCGRNCLKICKFLIINEI